MLKALTTLFLALLSTCFSYGQEIPAISTHYSTENGLTSNAISDIVQDKFGYVWIATWNGLCRYDGYTFTHYVTGPNSKIKNLHNRIINLTADVQGNIWMRMYDDRFFVLNRHTDKIEPAFSGIDGGEDFKATGLIAEQRFKRYDALTVSPDGSVYINIVGKGIYKLLLKGETRQCMPYVASGLKVYNMTCDPQGNLWIATRKGIRMVEAKTGRFKGNLMAKGEYINQMRFHGHDLYLATQSGRIIIRDTKLCKSISLPISNSEGPIYTVYTDKEGLVWYTNKDRGVWRLNLQTGNRKNFKQEVNIPEYDQNGATISETGDKLWARMNHGGFGVYNRQTDSIHYFYNDPQTPWGISNTVTTFLALPEGVIWMSTIKRGLEKMSLVNNHISREYIRRNDTHYGVNEVRAILYDKTAKSIWIGNKAGELFKVPYIAGKPITCEGRKPMLHLKGRIYGLYKDHRGDIWISTKGDGLYRLNVGSNTPIQVNGGLISKNVYTTIEDKSGNLWVATYGGGVHLLLHQADGSVRTLTPKQIAGYPRGTHLKVRTLAIDKTGIVWAGTSDGIMLLNYNHKQKRATARLLQEAAQENEQIAKQDIVEIAGAPDGSMWVATNGGGLCQIMGKDTQSAWRFCNFGEKEGLPSDEIRGITISDTGNVWFSTDQTICSYNTKKQLFTTFSVLDGVGDVACSESSAITLPDHRMLFGTVNGMYIVDRQRLSTGSGSTLKMCITDFFINDKLITPRNNDTYPYYVPDSGFVKLPSRTTVFAFKFASLNYQLQPRVHYQYILEGYDKKWQVAYDTRMVSYSDVPAGTYHFKVRAFLLESPDKYDERIITVVVPPYLLASPAAGWIYAIIVVGGILFYLNRRRLTRNEQIKNMRVLKVGPNELAFQNQEDYTFVKNIQDWLEAHYMESNMRIDDMVGQSHLSRTSFYNQLKSLTGLSPKEFVNEFKLKKAGMYLLKSNCTVAEIAYKTGFNDPVYFTRIFKQKMGVTPSAYRQHANQENDTEEK